MNSAPKAYGFSLFCDDIRQEVGGKTSIMGVYQADLIFPDSVVFPIGYPRFGILVKYYESSGAFSDDLELRIIFPGEDLNSAGFKMPILRSQMAKPDSSPHQIEADQERVTNLTIPIRLSPIQFGEEGFLKVRIIGKDRTVGLGSLFIRKIRPNENITFS